MKESEIRPSDLFNSYLALSKADAERMDAGLFVNIPCPGCQSKDSQEHFRKYGFTYRLCNNCGSLFCSPRPSGEQLNQLYRESESAAFWARKFFPAVAEARREKLFRPKAGLVAELLKEQQINPRTVCDVGAGYGVFLDELQKVMSESDFFAIEPEGNLAAMCRKKGFTTLEKSVEHASEWAGKFDFVICSEVIEHVFSTDNFVSSILNLLKPGGMAVLTGLGFEGFDILQLQSESRSISPPHHINFLSLEGFRLLMKRNGSDYVSIRTPGKLDVDIVLNSKNAPGWLQVLQQRGGDEAMQKLQDLFVEYKLSSHVWVIAQKKYS